MKKILIIIGLVISAQYTYSQNTFPASGDVTVGANINMTSGLIDLGFGKSRESNNGKIGYKVFSQGLDIVGAGTNPNGSDRLVTIFGNTNMYGNLNLSGGIIYGEAGTNTMYRDNAGLAGSDARSGFYQTYNPSNYPTGATSWWHMLDVRHTNPTNNYAMQFAGSFFDQKLFFRKTNNNAAQVWKEVILAESNGSVGIATTTIPTDYKLAVGGNVIAEKVVVKLKTDWPDFVFKNTYGLRPLEQVEQYINQNSHLPEVPSAEEISKTGIDLGQINAKLLQKVEELTLYLIEQNKEIKKLKNDIQKLTKE